MTLAQKKKKKKKKNAAKKFMWKVHIWQDNYI